MKRNFRFKLIVWLEDVNAGELEVSIPWELYEEVAGDGLCLDDFQGMMEIHYPEIDRIVNETITKAMWDGNLVDLDCVPYSDEPITMWSHSGPVTTDYKDAEDYVARVDRRYILASEWDEESQRELEEKEID